MAETQNAVDENRRNSNDGKEKEENEFPGPLDFETQVPKSSWAMKRIRPSHGWTENQSKTAQKVDCVGDKIALRQSLPRKSKLKKVIEVEEKGDTDEMMLDIINQMMLDIINHDEEKVAESSDKKIEEKGDTDDEISEIINHFQEKVAEPSEQGSSRNQSLRRKSKNSILKKGRGPKNKIKPVFMIEEEEGDKDGEILKNDEEKVVASSNGGESRESSFLRGRNQRGKYRRRTNSKVKAESPQEGSSENLRRNLVEKRPKQQAAAKPLFVRNYFIHRPFAIDGEKELDFVVHETYIKGTVPRDVTEVINEEVDVETEDEDSAYCEDDIVYSSCTEDEDNAIAIKLFEDIVADI